MYSFWWISELDERRWRCYLMLSLVMKQFLTSQAMRIPTMWRHRTCKILMPQFKLLRVCPTRSEVHFYLCKNCNQNVYSDILQNWVMSHLNENSAETFICQQAGVPPHYHNEVTRFLNVKILRWWTGSGGPKACPSWSPDVTSMDFLLWSCIKDQVKVSFCQAIFRKLRQDMWSCRAYWYRYLMQTTGGIHILFDCSQGYPWSLHWTLPGW